MRIDKLLSNLKYGSRKEIKQMIKDSRIIINNIHAHKESQIVDLENDIILIDNEQIFYKEEINLIINKPIGYLSANKDNLHLVVTNLLKEPYNRFDFKIAGRLDLDSHGLLILTTSGKLAHQITSPNSKIKKVYQVTLDSNVNDYNSLLDGIIIKDGKGNEYLARALEIVKIDNITLLITIDEGKFHQVKRMFSHLGNEVIDLKRIKIGNLQLNNLAPGEYREFDKGELL